MRKLTIEEMRMLADSKGGKCISTSYVDSRTKLEWECKNGHRWKAIPSSVKQGHWCNQCVVNQKKLTLKEMQEIAIARGGYCLSTEYINSQTKLSWECDSGHIWQANPDIIKGGTWCPKCAGKYKTIEDMNRLAEVRGGKCLSDQYLGAHTKLKWECAKGHIWNATPNNVQQEHWCIKCSGREKKSIQEMRDLAKSRGGDCLSEVYVNMNTKLLWECHKGHRWWAKPNTIQQEHWCPICSGRDKKTVKDMKEIAEKRAGNFISEKYINDNTAHEWECAEGHRWFATPNRIKQGTWCPECADNLSERICRQYFEQIFNEKFPTRKPRWLKNSRGSRMELDGFCKKLDLAFEYNGEQHYKLKEHFHKSESDLSQRMQDDALKMELCSKHDVKLIEVPYTVTTRKMKYFILSECKRLGVNVPVGASKKEIDLSIAYSKRKIEYMQELARIKGGKCLSNRYINAHTKLKWQCERGHEWFAKPNSIQQGTWCAKCSGKKRKTINEFLKLAEMHGGKCLSEEYTNRESYIEFECKRGHRWKIKGGGRILRKKTWCPFCSKRVKKTIEEMQEIAIARGGKCISTEYINVNSPLSWQCNKGHTWMARASDIIHKSTWCPKCAGKYKTIEDMNRLAEVRGGKCLSDQYLGAHTKLKWECAKGHIWYAEPNSVQRGHWCIKCSGSEKKSIQEMRDLAKSRGGDCLSEVYVNMNTKLLWECAKGHIWYAKPNKIQQGRWCAECSGKKRKTIEEMKVLARNRGGYCLSTEYINVKTKLSWQCNKGHTWMASAGNVINKGTWCAVCARRNRKIHKRYSISLNTTN